MQCAGIVAIVVGSMTLILSQAYRGIYFCFIQILGKAKTMTATTVFVNNRSQAIRLPAELRLPESVKRVDVRAHGCERIIAPLGQTWDSFFLDSQQVADDFLQTRASQNQPDRDGF